MKIKNENGQVIIRFANRNTIVPAQMDKGASDDQSASKPKVQPQPAPPAERRPRPRPNPGVMACAIIEREGTVTVFAPERETGQVHFQEALQAKLRGRQSTSRRSPKVIDVFVPEYGSQDLPYVWKAVRNSPTGAIGIRLIRKKAK